MNRFPKDIAFCHPWRKYQRDVLQHLHSHLENQHLHLVAPPGSGKTVLGLEVMLRINQPTLIVAPTLAIRNQWVNRFKELFLLSENTPSWISTDLRNPKFMTVTTYQGLHSLFQDLSSKAEDSPTLDDDIKEDESLLQLTDKEQAREHLFQQNFQTLILDEAHHLRTSWWKTIMSVKIQLTNPTIVALTATPPYDVGQSEWDKYIELCGPIDEEIDVAALVKEGDLCPHQDYIWMSMPTRKEREPIETFHREAEQLKDHLLINKDVKALLESHPWIKSDQYVEEKLSDYRYFISMMIYLKETGSEAWQMPFQLIDEKAKHLPSFDLEWAEELLTAMLYRDKRIDPKEEPLKSIKKQLSNIGALENRRVKLKHTKAMERTLLQSASKLDSITQIVSLEKEAQKEALRLVILADYIYADDLPNSSNEEKPLIRLGVIPIFEKMRRDLGENCKLGVLTGSIIILPKEAVSLLEAYSFHFQVSPLPHDDRYVTIKTNKTSNQYVVNIVTEIFSRGAVNVLVGTTALLGEGWDAPSVNTLILASYVGTFMLTNQMRGRAIRTERGNPNKAANIWHLVCVDEQAHGGGYDFYSLRRRFRSLTGIDEGFPVITSGLERLRLPHSHFSKMTISSINDLMLLRATNRKRLFERWQEAVHNGERKREELQTDQYSIPRPFIYRNTIKSMLVISTAIIINILYSIGESGYNWSERELLIQMLLGFVIGLVLSSPFWWKALRIVLFNSSVESSMKQVGNSIYHTLFHMGLIHTIPSHNKVHAEKMENGEVVCYLEHGTTHEQKLFLQCLQEIVDPINTPRYLLHRKSGKRFWVRHDYHAVPEEIGRKKEFAETLVAQWNKRVGNAELIYTRTPEGRRRLLKARMQAMSSKFVKKSERISVWK